MENFLIDKNMLKPLEDQLRCRICSEFYNNCVMAVCSHNFCSACIKQRLTTEDDCPNCFEIIRESDLRSNKLLDKLVRFYKKIQRERNSSNSEAHNQLRINTRNACGDSEIQTISVQSSVQGTVNSPSSAASRSSPLIHSFQSGLADLTYPVKLEVVECNESDMNDVVMSTNSAEDSNGNEFYVLLKRLIRNTLDDLPESQVEKILEILKAAGVKKAMHLKYVDVKDLSNVLDKIQSRMLINSFKHYYEKESDVIYSGKRWITNERDLNIGTDSNNSQERSNKSIEMNSPTIPDDVNLINPEDVVSVSLNKMPAQLLKYLNDVKELPQSQYRELVRIIADDIMQFTTTPPKKLVYHVAAMFVKKFNVLQDKFQGTTIGSGYDGLAYKLYSRLENLRRPKRSSFSICVKKSSIQNDDEESRAESSPILDNGEKTRAKRSWVQNSAEAKEETSICNKKRMAKILGYGCKAWAPLLPLNETLGTLEEKKTLAQQLNFKTDKIKCLSLMNETFYLQRKEINDGARIGDLLLEWPLLFQVSSMIQHFKILTGVDAVGKLNSAMGAKGKNIISFFQSSDKKEVKSFIIQNDNGKTNVFLLLLFGVMKYFEEDTSSFIKMSPVLNPRAVERLDVPNHPCLIGKGPCAMKLEEFMLVIDGIIVNNELKDPVTAFLVLFASFYIFNMEYPVGCSITLEFFQRCFLDINPVTGSKRERKKQKLHSGVHPKILKFSKQFQEFTSML